MRDLKVVRRIAELRDQVSRWRAAGESVGLVPTMGALHAGHMSLVQQAKTENRHAVATIFVNPTQFSPSEDLMAYPRDEAGDRAKLVDADCDMLFAPDVTEMYPQGFATSVSVSGLTEHLCGATRAGHFGGVATIVTKLLLQALPDRAYFGEKDFQQLQVIRRLVLDLDIPVEIVGVPTMRDADDLAMSSRNRYLSATDRQTAAALPKMMRAAATRLASGETVNSVLAETKVGLLKAGFSKLDYLELCNESSLQPVDRVTVGTRLFVAAYLGGTRLIDNWPVA